MSQVRSTPGGSSPSSASLVQNTSCACRVCSRPSCQAAAISGSTAAACWATANSAPVRPMICQAGRRPGGDPPGQGRGGHGLDHPVPAQHVHRFGIAHDGHVDHPLEQRRLGTEPHVHGARRHPGAPGHRLQRGGHIAVGQEQLGGRDQDPLLGQRGLRLPQGCAVTNWVDVSGHTLQYNCNKYEYTALEGECQRQTHRP